MGRVEKLPKKKSFLIVININFFCAVLVKWDGIHCGYSWWTMDCHISLLARLTCQGPEVWSLFSKFQLGCLVQKELPQNALASKDFFNTIFPVANTPNFF